MNKKKEEQLLKWYDELPSDDENYLENDPNVESSSSEHELEQRENYSEDSDDSIKDPDYNISSSEADSGESLLKEENANMVEGSESLSNEVLENLLNVDGDVDTLAQNSPDHITVDNSGESIGIGDSHGWSDTLRDNIDLMFDTSLSGPNQPLENFEPFQTFQVLWSEEIWNLILEKTNEYGRQLFQSNRPKKRYERFRTFREITLDELKKFFGLCLLGAQVKCREIRQMFSYDPLYYHPIFPATMSGRRFEQILRCLNCADENKQKDDNLYKVSGLVNLVINNSQNAFYPKEALSLDESLLLFRGRLKFRVYIKNKKSRYGIKFYELCSSDGYVLNMEIYRGKNSDDDARTSSKINDLVKRLMNPYMNRGHHLYMDNYYNSVGLSEELLGTYKTHTTGTLRSNKRDNPKHIVSKKLKKGEHIWSRKGDIYVSKWRDKRDVLAITTGHQPKLTEVENRFGQKRQKPVEIAAYNDNMSGIDRADQMISYYSCPRKTVRWYKKVIFHLLDISIWNAFYLYKINHAGSDLLTFRQFIIRCLLGLPTNEVLDGRDFVTSNPSRKRKRTSTTPKEAHFMEEIPIPETYKKKGKYYLRCRNCTKENIRKETCWRCKTCVDKPPLCPGTCFEIWHK